MGVPGGEKFVLGCVEAALLARERARVVALVRAAVPFGEVLEVGSTAVDGVIGKQDIDVMVRVPAAQFAAARTVLDRHFRRNATQISNAAYQGYLVDSALDAAIQLIVAGSGYDGFVAFLERLRADAGLREAYNALKRAWDGRPMDDYRAAKRAFIERVLEKEESSFSEEKEAKRLL